MPARRTRVGGSPNSTRAGLDCGHCDDFLGFPVLARSVASNDGALHVVAVPSFLPMASTAMHEILATACALVAIERLAAWKAEGKWSQAVAASIAMGLAGFAGLTLCFLFHLRHFSCWKAPIPGKCLHRSVVSHGCGLQ